MAHNTYFSYIMPSASPEAHKAAAALCLGGVLFWLGRSLTARLRSQGLTVSNAQAEGSLAQYIVPEQKLNLFGFFDLFLEGFLNFYDSILGKENRQHAPFIASVFVFILCANLLGLVPGMPAITTTVWINVAMALVVFAYFNWEGVKANGFWGYLKHFCGPVWWLAWFMFPLEIFSTALRVLTLNLRLYWNISADHEVLNVFTNLLGAGMPIVFYVLGTFVCFMQAFIFTTLSMVYILLATQHEEEH